jgi:hypothetical protein
VDVIPFIQCRVWFFVANGRNVITQWLVEIGATSSDCVALQSLIDICEYSGPDGLAYCILDLGDGFYALKCNRKGGQDLSPVFCRGPFSDTEITFLAGAIIEKKAMKPRYARGIAEENLEELLRNPQRRRRERIG